MFGFDGEAGETPPVLKVVFVDAVDGRPSPEFLKANPDFVIDGKATQRPALPAATE